MFVNKYTIINTLSDNIKYNGEMVNCGHIILFNIDIPYLEVSVIWNVYQAGTLLLTRVGR
jgi:hypothetical protein